MESSYSSTIGKNTSGKNANSKIVNGRVHSHGYASSRNFLLNIIFIILVF